MKGMKGEGEAIILVIALIVGIIAFLLIFSGGIFGGGGFIFGSTALPTQSFSDNVVSVNNKLISDQTPFDGQQTSIEFSVRNNGQGTVKGVEVVLEPPTGFTSSMTCGKQTSCKFDLEEGDEIDVVIKLIANEGISQIVNSDIKYSVRYPYTGEREAHIPIVKDRRDLPRGQSFFVSDPSIGPIEARIGTPPSRPTINGGSAVYALDDIDFEIKFDISRIGGGFFSNVAPIELNDNQLKISGTNVDLVFCDKVDETSGNLKEADGFEIPFSITCDFKPTATEQPVTDGRILIEYSYDYRLSFSDSFTIRPREVKEIETETSEGTDETGGDGFDTTDLIGGDSEEPVTEEGPGNPGSIGQVGGADLPGHR